MTQLTDEIKSSYQLNTLDSFTESFESLVDLFTILSFVLIAAAFFFGVQRVQKFSEGDLTAEIELREIIRGAAPLPALPKDIVVIFVDKQNKSDIIQFTKQGTTPTTHDPSKADLDTILGSELKGLQSTKKIHIVFFEGPSEPNYRLVHLIEKWLFANGFNKLVKHIRKK